MSYEARKTQFFYAWAIKYLYEHSSFEMLDRFKLSVAFSKRINATRSDYRTLFTFLDYLLRQQKHKVTCG